MRTQLVALALAVAPLAVSAAPPEVKLVRRDADRRVDVLVDGAPFTSYLWPETQKKPLLWPLRTDKGVAVTRGFPFEPKPAEATDHPHHVGLWLNYGDVDGVDFWNHSEEHARAHPELKFGSIVHGKIVAARGGRGRGELQTTASWVMPDGKVALREDTRLAFGAASGRRTIDRITTLTADGGAVRMPDNKEGVFGLRLGRALEHRSDKNPDGTGQYLSSEGKVGDAVWGTRGRWVLLTGQVEGGPVTVAILDHPRNPGHPTYWHARGYGLFAANPLGQKILSKGKDTLDYALPKGGRARFAYRVLLLSRLATADQLETEWKQFVAEVK